MNPLRYSLQRRTQRKSHMRPLVWKRDHGVCALCGWDTGRLAEILEHAEGHFRDLVPRDGRFRDASVVWFRATVLLALGLPVSRKELWEDDHVIPVIVGGSDELANHRTLCIPCHKIVTRGQQSMIAKLARLRNKVVRKPPVGWALSRGHGR